MTNYSFNHLLGTKDDGTKTVRLELLRDGSIWTSFNSPEDVQGFILACREAVNYLEDIAQQTHLHCTPSSAPTVPAGVVLASFNAG